MSGNRSFRYELKWWNCTKILITASIVCVWTRKIFWVVILHSLYKPKAWNYLQFDWINLYRVVKSSQLLVKIPAYLVSSIGCLLCLAFLYGCHFLNEISLDWPQTLTTQQTASCTIFIFTTLLVSKWLVSKWLCIKMTSNHVSWYPSALACLPCFAVSVTL